MHPAQVFVEDYETKKVKYKQSAQEKDVCVLCFGVSESELQPVTASPLAKEFNNFIFIEAQIGYTLPACICQKCITKLTDVASFIKMCKNSFTIYTQIEEQQKRNNQTAIVKDHLTLKHSSESNERNKETGVDENHSTPKYIKGETNESLESSNEICEPVIQTKVAAKVGKVELNLPDALRDHLYHKRNFKIDNGKIKYQRFRSENIPDNDITKNKVKICPMCKKTVHTFTDHYRQHPRCQPKKNIPLKVCPTCKESVPTLRNHYRQHPRCQPNKNNPKTMKMCPMCKENVPTLKNHYRQQPQCQPLKKTQNKLKLCQTCGENVLTLTNHYIKNPSCQPNKIQCPKCMLRVRDNNRMQSHQKAHHPDCDGAPGLSGAAPTCHICLKTLKHAASLERHLMNHYAGKQFTCEQCGKSYTTAVQLRGHQNVHFNIKPYLCANCGKQFSTRTGLYIHDRQVHNRKRKLLRKPNRYNNEGEDIENNEDELVACKICYRHFTEFGLKIHMHTHDDDKRHYCQKCKIAFETALLYRQHSKIHEKRNAECPCCLKKYPRSELKQHVNTHTEERPFSCPECGKLFRRRIHMMSHRLAIHNVNRGKPLKCKFCNRNFTFNGNLRVHERIHTGEKPYACHVCDEAFSDTKKRKKHVAQMHGEDEVQNINYLIRK